MREIWLWLARLWRHLVRVPLPAICLPVVGQSGETGVASSRLFVCFMRCHLPEKYTCKHTFACRSYSPVRLSFQRTFLCTLAYCAVLTRSPVRLSFHAYSLMYSRSHVLCCIHMYSTMQARKKLQAHILLYNRINGHDREIRSAYSSR